jgi:hypothetical protein
MHTHILFHPLCPGVNPVKQFEPVVLTAVVDGVLACKKEPFAYTKLFTFKQLGLSKPLVPTANGQGLQAMCSVTAMSQVTGISRIFS